MRSLVVLLLATLSAFISGVARAEPLTLAEWQRLDSYLSLEAKCLELPAFKRAQCRQAMQAEIGTSSPVAAWEKDGVQGISSADLQRAVAEFWDEGSMEYICYGDSPSNIVVNFAENCGSASCIKNRTLPCKVECASDTTCADDTRAPCACVTQCTARDCADADKDGFFAYQEAERNLDDHRHDTCRSGADCGFGRSCQYLTRKGGLDVRPICQPRTCPDGKCTAFHLETVSFDRDEVIVHVHFDHAPVPVTVLDLYLSFDPLALTLTDARALPTLAAVGQALKSSQPAEGELRLSVFGTDNKRPIEPGAIAELVFSRRTSAEVEIKFSRSAHRRKLSLAPNPGVVALVELAKDELWGKPISIPAVSSDSGRLLLHYSFDNSLKPIEQNLSLRGEELCPTGGVCKAQIEGSSPPTTDLGRSSLQGRINSLQRGTVETSQTIDGVVGTAAFMDGYANHLELPLTFHAGSKEQDFSLGVWFFSKHDTRTASQEQVIFSHNSPSEKTQYSVLLRADDDKTFSLRWLEGNLSDDRSPPRYIARGLTYGAWRHLAVLLDAAPQTSGQAGTVRILLNGKNAMQRPLSERPGCPAFAGEDNERLQLHETGAPDRVPEALLLTTRRNNLAGIDRVDSNGLSAQTLVREASSSARDAHYSALLRKLVFASDRTGSYEIWVANADGTEPKQITRGFGDASRQIVARRPRWAPDGSAIVFESNVYDLPARDNWITRSTQLYYIAYNAERGEVAVPVANGSPRSELDYQSIRGNIQDYRLTRGTNHHFGVRWKRGGKSGSDLGELLFTTADASWRTRSIGSIQIPTLINQTKTELVLPFGQPLPQETQLELLALHSERKLWLRTQSSKSVKGRVALQQKQLVLQVGEKPPIDLTVPGLEQVLAADFSPSGTEVVLSAIMASRPVLASATLPASPVPGSTLSSLRVLSSQPTKVDSLQWMKLEQLHACNWLGAYRQPTGNRPGSYDFGFRGGLDELKVYGYVRSEAAFRSEAERGLERLELDGGATSDIEASCGDDFDCPSYQLCNSVGRCAAVECSDSNPCKKGKCSLQPVPRGGHSDKRVCSVECEADTQCFTQQCLNGPCRYCDASTLSCQECRTVTQTTDGLQSTRTEGCPDRSTYACHEGSCITECYSFNNDQSTYLCAPGLEYCSRGKCESFKWSWNDLSPMTLTGIGEMSFAENGQALLPRTTAISQSYPIEIVAFGSEDYGVSPEIIVEGLHSSQGFQMYSGQWFELGRVQVHHRTAEAATQDPYVLQTPYPITDIRVRLHTDSYTSGFSANHVPGSRRFLGYSADVSYLEQLADCAGKPECPKWSDTPRMRYLRSGQPTVIVDSITVNQQLSRFVKNYVCLYEKINAQDTQDHTEPLGLGGEVRAVSAKEPPYDRAGNLSPDATALAWGLLNCGKIESPSSTAVSSPNQPVAPNPGSSTKPPTIPKPSPKPVPVQPQVVELARALGPEGAAGLSSDSVSSRGLPSLEAEVPSGTFPTLGATVLKSGSISETAQCLVELDATRTMPCYEWMGAGVSLDPYGDLPQANRTLDYGTFQSFGCDGLRCSDEPSP